MTGWGGQAFEIKCEESRDTKSNTDKDKVGRRKSEEISAVE